MFHNALKTFEDLQMEWGKSKSRSDIKDSQLCWQSEHNNTIYARVSFDHLSNKWKLRPLNPRNLTISSSFSFLHRSSSCQKKLWHIKLPSFANKVLLMHQLLHPWLKECQLADHDYFLPWWHLKKGLLAVGVQHLIPHSWDQYYKLSYWTGQLLRQL